MAKKSKAFAELLREQKQSQKNLQDLQKKIEQSAPDEFQKMVINPPGVEKMSDVLRNFAAPYAKSLRTIEEYRKFLTLAITAWNISLLPEQQQSETLEDMLRQGFRSPDPEILPDPETEQEIREILQELIERRKTDFAQYQRFIVDFNLEDRGKDFHLSVASTLIEEKKVSSSGSI